MNHNNDCVTSFCEVMTRDRSVKAEVASQSLIVGFFFPVEEAVFCSLSRPYRLWGPYSLLWCTRITTTSGVDSHRIPMPMLCLHGVVHKHRETLPFMRMTMNLVTYYSTYKSTSPLLKRSEVRTQCANIPSALHVAQAGGGPQWRPILSQWDSY